MSQTPAEVPPWEQYSDDAMLEMLGGNRDALRLCNDLSFICHIYDDLIDGDKPVRQKDIHSLIWKAMLALPANPFYRTHEGMFRPLLVTSILNWHAANQMEKSGSVEQLRVAHVIRFDLASVILMASALTCGQEYAAENAARIRLMLQNDTWANYSKEHLYANPSQE